MKHLKYKFLNALYINLLLISCLGLCISCSDDTLGHVSIDSVWSNWLNEDKTTPESVRINTCYLGKWIALKGSGFSTLEGVYCNGYLCPVKEYNKTDNWIIVEIPWSVPMASEIDDENIKNTIRVVTKNGESVYRNFVFKNPYLKPAVKSVSFTLPVAGQCITLNGENLHDASEIYFPGETEEIKGEIVNVDSYNVTVRVPAGNMTSGALRLVCVDESVYSPNYMYHTDGLLLSDEELYSEITLGSNCAVVTGQNNILSLTGLNTDSYCPENIICMPETPKALAKAAGYDRLSGYYMEFDAAPALKKALDNSSNIYETSSMADLAIQYDIYMKNPWTSGSSTIRLMRNGNISSSANNFFYTPWVFDERASTYYFENGWETVTIPLKNFEAIVTSSTRLIDFIEVLESRGDKSMLAFINCYLNSYNQNICSAVSDFQAFFANLRLVPYATRENQ